MRINRKTAAIAATLAVLGLGAGGFAYAVSDDDAEEQVTGPAAERAKSAALDAVSGTVTSVEREDGDGAGAFEVEVKRADGSQVEIAIDNRYRVLGTAPDEDTGSESDDDGEDD